MPKRRLTLSFRLPPYSPPRNEWRKQIKNLALEEVNTRNIIYLESDQLQIDVRLYLEKTALIFHDVDKRLKDIMDALQGRAGGPKKTVYSNQSSQTTAKYIVLLLRNCL